MHEYEYFLVRTLAKKATTHADLADMRQAETDAQSLLIDLVRGEPDQMAGWEYGNVPENQAQALARVMTLISVELNAEIYEFMRLTV
jgi:ABC-type transporter Mla MlaB component